MQAIPEQLAARLPAGTIRLGVRVVRAEPGAVTLATGETVRSRAVVVATEGPEAAQLVQGLSAPASRGVNCLHFAAPAPPLRGPWLVLNGEGATGGPVNSLTVMSEVSAALAPAGQALVSVTVLDGDGAARAARAGAEADAALEQAVRAQLGAWFGAPAVGAWRLLRTDRITHAQPEQSPAALEPAERPVRMAAGLFVCGDHRDQASLQGALASGRRAANAVLGEFGIPVTS
jgi:protoporphyrinogen oxidase